VPDNKSKAQLDYYDGAEGVLDYEKTGILQRGLDRAFKRKAKIIKEKLGDTRIQRVLEIGAGSGLLTFFSVNELQFDRYTALDLSSEMLSALSQRITRPEVEILNCDINKIDANDCVFTAVIGSDVIHHLENPVDSFKELLRVTAPGGKICILETNALNPIILRNIGVEHEVRAFLNTDTNLLKWLESAGWKNCEVIPAPSFTPAGPRCLHWFFDLVDRMSVHIPYWKKMCALWLVYGEKPT